MPEIVKQVLIAPTQHGGRLCEPSPESLPQLWQNNLQLGEHNRSLKFGDSSLGQLQSIARSELVQLAQRYSSRYQDVAEADSIDSGRVILAGHQPELFHPGIWLKHFFLSRLGEQFGAVAINLIVDNDLCENRSILVPTGNLWPQEIVLCPLDTSTAATLFEHATIQDVTTFISAGQRISGLLKPLISDPIVDPLWPEVIAAMERMSATGIKANELNFGQALAAGRHRLETKCGLKTREVPLSWLAQSSSFAQFAWPLLIQANRFLLAHNEGLVAYRQAYRLRSKTHPFPNLEKRGDWIETPFWVLTQPWYKRERMFVRQAGNTIELSDLQGWQSAALTGAEAIFIAQQEGRFQIRPRAVTTTLFSRMLLSDLFIHGIGGGKYDPLTDSIAAQFWGVQLPRYCVVSGTYKLFPQYPSVSSHELALRKHRLRELEMNPDKFLVSAGLKESLSDAAISAIEEKRAWINQELVGDGKTKHAAITRCNEILKREVAPLQQQFESELQELEGRRSREERFGSREFSFCLHRRELIDELRGV